MANQQKQDKLDVNINIETTPILYTDNVVINANEDGIVLNVGQKLLNTNQIRIVSRIGMSRHHAKKFAAELSKLLAMTEGHHQSGEKKN